MPAIQQLTTDDVKFKKPNSELSSYAELIGVKVKNPISLSNKIKEGFSTQSFFRLQKTLNIGSVDLANLVQITPRTLARRKTEGRLRPDESDRLLRITRVVKMSNDLFDGDNLAARAWLMRPNRSLDGNVPLYLAKTEVGAREVERLIIRLNHGVST